MPKYAQKSKKFITEKLIDKIPAEILHTQISEELFERDYTIYDWYIAKDNAKIIYMQEQEWETIH